MARHCNDPARALPARVRFDFLRNETARPPPPPQAIPPSRGLVPADPPPGRRFACACSAARIGSSSWRSSARATRCTVPGPTRPSAPTSSTSSQPLPPRGLPVPVACLVDDGAISGVFTISQIVRGAFQSAYLGYYAHERHAGQGRCARRSSRSSTTPSARSACTASRPTSSRNAPSIALARGAGFRLEGFSPRYLLIGGRGATTSATRSRPTSSGGEGPRPLRRGRAARGRAVGLGSGSASASTSSGSGTTSSGSGSGSGCAGAGSASSSGIRAKSARSVASMPACRARRPGGRAGTAARSRGPIVPDLLAAVQARDAGRGSARSSLVAKLPSVQTTRGSISSSWRNR